MPTRDDEPWVRVPAPLNLACMGIGALLFDSGREVMGSGLIILAGLFAAVELWRSFQRAR